MKKTIILLFVAYLTFVHGFMLYAQTPGTSSDPLVTKSYLDFTAKLRKVELKSGTNITAETGALLIVMSGQLKLVLKKGAYVIDLTSGRKISSSLNLQAFHLVMIPDGDQCSFKASKDTTLMAIGLNDEAE